MSRKHIFEAVLLALSVLLVVAKTIDGMDGLPEFLDRSESDI